MGPAGKVMSVPHHACSALSVANNLLLRAEIDTRERLSMADWYTNSQEGLWKTAGQVKDWKLRPADSLIYSPYCVLWGIHTVFVQEG